MDMSQFTAPKSSQLNADDLVGGPRTITVAKVSGTGNAEQPVAISFEGDEGRPYLPCKGMRRILIAVWGKDASQYAGRSVTLYRDPKVTWGGMEVGGIRISHASHIERDMVIALTETKKSRKPFIVKPLVIEQPKQAEDKVTPGVNTLVARIDAAADAAALEEITGNADVIKQRAWLAKNRPALATKIDDAVSARLADFDGAIPSDDDFPGQPSNRDGSERE